MFFGDFTKGNKFTNAGVGENNVDSPLHLTDCLVETIQVGQFCDVSRTPVTFLPIAVTASGKPLFRELPLGLSGKAEASSVRSAPPEALRLVESRYPLGYFAANTPASVFSCPATKAPVAAFSMK